MLVNYVRNIDIALIVGIFTQDDFDIGYRPLMISADDDTDASQSQSSKQTSLETSHSYVSNNNHSQDYSARDLQQFDINASARAQLEADPGHEASGSEQSSESEQLPPQQQPVSSALIHNPDSLSAMTLGAMADYASDDSQDYKRLVISPAIYRGQNTPIAKPRQPTPSKTRRKSDKVGHSDSSFYIYRRVHICRPELNYCVSFFAVMNEIAIRKLLSSKTRALGFECARAAD